MKHKTVVQTLTPAQHNAQLSAGAATCRIGSSVTLWRVPGTWQVWADGPQRGTVWLAPADDDAREVMAQLEDGASGVPVIVGVWRGKTTATVAVSVREARPYVTHGGES